jgi:septal ring factor EnvC (AmiA/AmiB activator)
MTEFWTHVLDRWALLAYVAGLLSAVIWGRAKRHVEQVALVERVTKMEFRLAELERRVAGGDTQFAVLVTEMNNVKLGLQRIETQLANWKD